MKIVRAVFVYLKKSEANCKLAFKQTNAHPTFAVERNKNRVQISIILWHAGFPKTIRVSEQRQGRIEWAPLEVGPTGSISSSAASIPTILRPANIWYDTVYAMLQCILHVKHAKINMICFCWSVVENWRVDVYRKNCRILISLYSAFDSRWIDPRTRLYLNL